MIEIEYLALPANLSNSDEVEALILN